MKTADEIGAEVYKQVEEQCVTCMADECRDAGIKLIVDAIQAERTRTEKLVEVLKAVKSTDWGCLCCSCGATDTLKLVKETLATLGGE